MKSIINKWRQAMIKQEIDLGKIQHEYTCPKCYTQYLVPLTALIYDDYSAQCPKCESINDPTGKPFQWVTSPETISKLRDVFQRVTKSYQSDFIRDECALQEYGGAFLWGAREGGTDLVLMPDPMPRNYAKDTIVWILGTEISQDHGNHIRYYNGEKLTEVTSDEAAAIWDDYWHNTERKV